MPGGFASESLGNVGATIDCGGAGEVVVAGDESDPVGAAQAVAGADSSVSVTYGSEAVSVTVSCPVIPDPLGVLPTVVTAEATGVAQ